MKNEQNLVPLSQLLITFSCSECFQLREKATLRIKQVTEVKAVQLLFIHRKDILLPFNNFE